MSDLAELLEDALVALEAVEDVERVLTFYELRALAAPVVERVRSCRELLRRELRGPGAS